MMFEILSFVFGGVFRLLPELLKWIDKQREREHEARMLDLQMKADEQRAKLEVQKAEVEGRIKMDLAEVQALIAATQAQATVFQKTGNKWLDALMVLAETASTFVRPILTYWYCVLMYGAYKAAAFYLLLDQGGNWKEAVTTLWTANDVAVMMSIIGFWFVDRAIRKR
jgi:hypothetical protein